MGYKRHGGQWGSAKRYGAFASRPYEFTPGVHHYRKILLTDYCKQKFITRKQAMRLIRKKWLAVTRFNGRLFVHEICPDQINADLDWRGARKMPGMSP